MKHLKFLLAIILMLIVVVLIVQNHEAMSTRVQFKVNILTLQFQSPQLSLYHIVTITFLFGVIISGLYGIIERFQLKKEIKALRSAAQDRDTELNSLRNLPITSDDVNVSEMDKETEAEKGEA
ncbi:LapA family protein [Thermodesulfobacteriota bacterium]